MLKRFTGNSYALWIKRKTISSLTNVVGSKEVKYIYVFDEFALQNAKAAIKKTK